MPRNRKTKTHLSHNKRVEKKMKMIEGLNPFVSNHIHKLEKENESLKTDPQTLIGQLVPQMREAITQNKRLSVLAAALIEAQGGKITLSKESLQAFESKVLNIKWELPEGVESAELAESFIFTYEATEATEPTAQNQPQITLTPVEGEPVIGESLDAETTLGEINEELEFF